MDISVSEERARVPVTVFQIEGAIAAESYEQLQQKGQEAFDAGTRNLLLDLTNVTSISSSGLRAIHYLYTLLRTGWPEESAEAVRKGLAAGTYQSPHLKLLNPSRNVLQALKLAGYDMFLEIHSDLHRAIASF